MAQRDIVVVGGSAGSIGPLKEILRALPADFPGSILIVIHVAEDSPGSLAGTLSRWCSLPISYPADLERIQRGHIYVARPNFHLTLEDSAMRVMRGPRENRHRPAIDPLFRTAARTYGSRVIGLVLSGQDDDGSAGLYGIKQRGGVAIVQDPRDAKFAVMPARALEYATPHYILRTQDIAPNLVKLVHVDEDESVMSKPNANPENSKKESGRPAEGAPDANRETVYSDEGEGKPSVFACPECGGVLWELKNKDVRFRCRVGHSYSPQNLAHELSQSSETALWAAMRALEEKAAMQRRIADGLGENRTSQRLRDQSVADDTNARLIREIIFRGDAELEPEAEESEIQDSESGEAA